MIAIILIAIIAGSASALMFASIISGALISLVLLYLAPLPLMVAALGWGPLSATVGGIAAASGLGAIFGLPYCIAFVVAVALPAWWLGHLALLGRPVAHGVPSGNGAPPAAPDLEWYPLGRILLWISGFAALTTMAALLTLGSDATAIGDALRKGLLRIIGVRQAGTVGETEQWIEALVTVGPAAAAMVAMTTLALNLWLAAKITATSGRLHRPWADLKSLALPPMTLAAFCVAIALCFSGGLLSILARIVAAVLMMSYAFTGFAVLHTLTLALKSRALWLGCTYAIVVAFSWPILAMAALGLADAVFAIRRRYLQGRPPPLPTS
ncbi:MAG TPA: DUF2232 domain-containing protein [Bradyrhizobium sp.]|jgi:hypothetical protein|nr:DUF2232 domain-containing protein [Bradyrhizobium sp.]